jgi:hypothetical protein
MAEFQGQMTPQEQMREMARMKAIGRNHKFITLVLKDEKKRNAIFGIEIVNAVPFVNDQKGGVQDFQIEVKGGALQFEWDMGEGESIAKILDSKHNRAFLASHYYGQIDRDGRCYPYWVIKDEDINTEIKKMADEIKKDMVQQAPSSEPTYKVPEEVKQQPKGFVKNLVDAAMGNTTAANTSPSVPSFVKKP